MKSEPNAKFVAFYDLVKFKSDFLNKNFTTLLASFEVRSAQTLSFEVWKDPAARGLGNETGFHMLNKEDGCSYYKEEKSKGSRNEHPVLSCRKHCFPRKLQLKLRIKSWTEGEVWSYLELISNIQGMPVKNLITRYVCAAVTLITSLEFYWSGVQLAVLESGLSCDSI